MSPMIGANRLATAGRASVSSATWRTVAGIGAELRGHLLGDAPGEIVAEHRVLEDVVGQTLRSGT